MTVNNKILEAEIRHGKWLVESDPVMQWGWGTPAGKLRASRRAALIAEGAGLAPGMNVLEIGCGTGLFTEMFAAYGANILAVDLSQDLLDLAEQRQLPRQQVTFKASAFEECDIHGPFDAVIGSSVLHHLDCGKAFKKIYELLRPGGVMSFCEPNMLNPQVWFTLRFRRFFPFMSPDETAFYRRGLADMLVKAGFGSVAITPFDWLHPQVPPALIKSAKSIERILEALPVVRELAGSHQVVARKP